MNQISTLLYLTGNQQLDTKIVRGWILQRKSADMRDVFFQWSKYYFYWFTFHIAMSSLNFHCLMLGGKSHLLIQNICLQVPGRPVGPQQGTDAQVGIAAGRGWGTPGAAGHPDSLGHSQYLWPLCQLPGGPERTGRNIKKICTYVTLPPRVMWD